MGLDMYLNKTRRVGSLSTEDYAKIEGAMPWEIEKYDKKKGLTAICNVKDAFLLNDAVRERGNSFKYLSIFEEVGYWRKENAVHNWFVKNCQDGIDKCQLTEVSKESLEKLLKACKSTISTPKSADKKLPTRSGFFFGSVEYDEYYIKGIKRTLEVIGDVLDSTDFDEEIVFYQSSW